MENLQLINNQQHTFENMWALFQETREMFRETDKKFQETDKKFEKTDKKFEKTEQLIDKMREESEKSARKLNKIGKLVGSMGRNTGEYAEEYFYRRLKNQNNLLGIEFSHIKRNLYCETGKLDGQYDIVLQNGQYIFVIEVKYKLHANDIIRFKEKALPKFKLLFPEYEDKKIYVAMAGMVVIPDCKQLCEDYGFLLLSQAGKEIAILNTPDFIALTF